MHALNYIFDPHASACVYVCTQISSPRRLARHASPTRIISMVGHSSGDRNRVLLGLGRAHHLVWALLPAILLLQCVSNHGSSYRIISMVGRTSGDRNRVPLGVGSAVYLVRSLLPALLHGPSGEMGFLGTMAMVARRDVYVNKARPLVLVCACVGALASGCE